MKRHLHLVQLLLISYRDIFTDIGAGEFCFNKIRLFKLIYLKIHLDNGDSLVSLQLLVLVT